MIGRLHAAAVRRLALPLAGGLFHRDFPRLLRLWEESQRWPRERLEEHRRERLRALVAHAAASVPFYRDHFRARGLSPGDVRGPEDLALLPVVGREEVRREGLERFVSAAAPAAERIRESTSGTSGEPFAFFIDRHVVASKMARLLRENRWAGWEAGERYLRLWGPHREGPGKRLFYRRLMRRVEVSAFTLERDFDAVVALFERLRPRVVEAYASAAVTLARLCRDRGRTIPPPQAIVVSAETLSAAHRALIEETLGGRVYNRYGSRELGNVAHECERGGFHLNAESFYVEEGEHPEILGARELLISFLDNTTMPLLRYRIGDLGRLAVGAAGECPCGRTLPLLAAVEGRRTDFFVFADGSTLSFLYFNHFFEQWGGRVDLYQVEQVERDRLEVRVVPAPGFTAADRREIERRLTADLAGRSACALVVARELPREASGKLRLYRALPAAAAAAAAARDAAVPALGAS